MATEGNSSVASVAIVVIVVIAAIVILLTIRNAEDDPDLEIDLPEIEVNELNPPEGASPQELWHIGYRRA